MIFSEILVLFLALVIAITLVLMLRKLFFGRKSKIQIDKKVNKIANYIKKISPNKKLRVMTVSYTHLTLPTTLQV